MADLDPEVVETTQVLLDAVAEVVGPDAELFPTSALLIYKTMNRDGEPKLDWVMTHDLDMSDAAGLSAIVHDAALRWFRDQDEDDQDEDDA